MPRRNTPRLAFIGFGEAGQAFAAGLREAGVESMAAWDILFPDAAGARLRQAADDIGVRAAQDAADAVRGADMIIAAVTAASSLDAARSVAAHLSGQPWYLDINSVSPGRKRETATALGDKARYVDVAVMAPVHPKRHKTPLLLAGPDAPTLAPLLTELGMTAPIGGAEIGNAAAIKMVRSVMIKGIEALTLECFLAAHRAGVVDQVAASLSNNYPGVDWDRMIPYNIERMGHHGIRRAAEMEQVADTLRELGVAPLMAQATVTRHQEMGDRGKELAVAPALDGDLTTMLAAISQAFARRS